ncbi:MAG TPA: cytochrome c oxidase assembly factor Coa1 family protein [Thermoanaerobaculia bacterium]|nr:cytochrome c oxidase assembly factor Coa1 family protein [Thermoanaerobaculia bacterium]
MEPMPSAQPQPSWWSRNWKWVVPAGCLILVLPVLALAGFIGGILAIVFGSIKSTDVCQQALTLAKSNPAVIEALGQPVEDGWLMSGNINASGSSGSADVSIPLHGPKGKGTLYAVATKSAGRWEYDTLEVEVQGRDDRINLLEAERGGS